MEDINDIFKKVIAEINSNEKKGYGDIVESMSKTAELTSLLTNKTITARDAFIFMIALKLTRESYTHHEDNIVDLIGYLDGYLKLIK